VAGQRGPRDLGDDRIDRELVTAARVSARATDETDGAPTRFSARLWAAVELDDETEPAALAALLAALQADGRALEAACAYESELRALRVGFQVEVKQTVEPLRSDAVATAVAVEILDAALDAAGVDSRTTAVAIAQDEPD
jgi:hypothetical protein